MQPTRRTVLGGAAAAVALAWAAPRADATGLAPTAGSSCPLDPHADKTDLRGIWIASVTNIDWPSRPGLTPAQQQAELVAYYDLAVAQNYNTVVVQVRPTADAFWPSPLEPWSKYLTGTQGGDPGYDPLAFAVAEAHRRNLEFHAWFNPYRITMNLTTDVAGLAATHPAKVHPEWTIPYGGRLYYNPGIPEAREFCQAAIMDAVTKYDIDAVHFDDYFYPYPVAGEVFHDEAQYAQYGAGRSLADWRRDNINALITGLGSAIKAAKPWVKFGVSPFGVWMNKVNDEPLGFGHQSRRRRRTRTCMRTPADGCRRSGSTTSARRSTGRRAWRSRTTTSHRRLVVAAWSTATTCTSTSGRRPTRSARRRSRPSGTPLPDGDEQPPALQLARPQVDGNIYFSAKDVRANRLDGMGIVQRDWYSHPALVPPMPWLDATPPSKAPKDLSAVRGASGTTLRWRAGEGTTVSFAIYRIPVTADRVKDGDCRLADATQPRGDRAGHGRVHDVDRHHGRRAAVHLRHHRGRPAVERVDPAAGHARLTRPPPAWSRRSPPRGQLRSL